MRNIVLGALVLIGCAHRGTFAAQYAAVASGAQNTGRSGPLVVARVGDGAVQVTHTATTAAELRGTGDRRHAEQLVASVQARLAGDGKVKHRDIKVAADDAGVVTLVARGEPTHVAARAVLDAFSVPGVRVVNTDFR